MKKLAFLTILLGLSLAVSFPNPNLVSHPRNDNICSNMPGWFWDGQKCESCYSANCFCKSYKGCDKCELGYTLQTIPGTNKKTCFPCDPVISTGGANVSPAPVVTPVAWQWGDVTAASTNAVASCCNNINNTYSTRAQSCYNVSDWQNPSNNTFVLLGSYCHTLSNCVAYTDYGACTQCKTSHYMDRNGDCQPCSVSGCQACQRDGHCSQCKPGFYLGAYLGLTATVVQRDNIINNPNICIPCQAGCLCSNNGVCTGCINNSYYFDSANTASPCTACTTISGCSQCSFTPGANGPVCTQCSTKFVLSSGNDGNKCIACPSNCKFCSTNSTNPEVTTCNTGSCENSFYGVVNGQGNMECKSCATDVSNSIRCDWVNGNLTALSCKQKSDDSTTSRPSDAYGRETDYFLFKNPATNTNQCVLNTKKCKKMLDFQGNCESCYTDFNYVLVDDKSCKHCDSNCLRCQKSTTTPTDTECLTCAPGFFIQQGKCSQCAAGCQTCTSTGCQKCYEGYQLKGNTCTKCAIIGCATCNTDVTKCETCTVGYRKWASTNNVAVTCDACDRGCVNCDANRKICNLCAAGWYNLNGVCEKQRSRCITQNSNGECTDCAYGSRLVDGRCLSCANIGYVNCPYGCENDHNYLRDGDRLNKATEPEKAGASYLLFNAAALIFFFIMLAF